MTVTSVIILLVIAAICGAIGQAIVGYSRAGLLGTIAIGFIGAMLGVWIGHQLGLPEWYTLRIRGESFPIVWSILGSALFVALISLVSGRRGRTVYG